MASPTFHAARLMGAWVIDMSDLDAAHAAIGRCRTQAPEATLEVRHTLWGVQVRTTDAGAAGILAGQAVPETVAIAA